MARLHFVKKARKNYKEHGIKNEYMEERREEIEGEVTSALEGLEI